jgi:hypothetical protein
MPMGEIYLSNESIPSAKKRKILELIERGPATGEISVTLHQAAQLDSDDFNHIEPSWTYDYGTDPKQIEAVVESIDRHIANGFAGGHRYGGATIRVARRLVDRAD